MFDAPDGTDALLDGLADPGAADVEPPVDTNAGPSVS
jgi:hypothetical protein